MNEARSGAPLGQEALFDLMAYADGELQGEAAERVEAWIASDPEAARLVDEFRTLSDCVAISEKARPVPKSVDGIVDSVMAQAARIDPDRVANVPKAVRIRRAIAAGSVSAVIAMAAVWFLFFRPVPKFDDEPSATQTALAPPIEPSAAPTPAESTDPALAAASPSVESKGEGDVEVTSSGVELEQVESPQREISVFYVPSVSAPTASSIVVWIGDNKPGTSK
ncbi:anti-sigma factor family protein [Pendulispora albinea]|uniref:Anti-sigma factor n=1 Tax=Pendulispora albinea TaxID=2741071 RepID=A0ABZ2M1E0_9BACT